MKNTPPRRGCRRFASFLRLALGLVLHLIDPQLRLPRVRSLIQNLHQRFAIEASGTLPNCR